MTEVAAVLRSATSAWASTVVEVSFEVLVAAFGSVVPSEATQLLFWSTVRAATELGTFRWIVISGVPPAGRPPAETQVTTWAAAVQPVVEPTELKTVPVGRVSVTVKPPTLLDGPLLV